MEPLKHCIFTGLATTNYREVLAEGIVRYSISLNGVEHDFVINTSSIYDIIQYNKGKAFLYRALLLNGKKIPTDKTRMPYCTHLKILEEFMEVTTYPKTASEKLDNLFIELAKMQAYEGERFTFLLPKVDPVSAVFKYYFYDVNELYFYINTLQGKNLLAYSVIENTLGKHFAVQFSYEGLIERIKLTEEGENSKRCFVAMSFHEKEKIIYTEVIKPVIEQFGFQAIRVDELHPGADQTINDLIIAEIKRSKFLISDFTGFRGGVYYEAGYGAGRGKKVIYACPDTEKDKLHFDVKHFSFILYDNFPDFKQKLINKIQAYILD